MRHSRLPRLVEIPTAQVVSDPEAGSDKRFIQLYKQLLLRKIDTARTRLPINSIYSGYYERDGNTVVRVSSLKPENVTVMERAIQSGLRPELVLYWSPFAPGGGAYVCSDDEAALAAYQNLNFGLVPCSILRPKLVDATEASIWLQNHGENVGVRQAIPPKLDSVPCFVHDGYIPFSRFIKFLLGHCQVTRKAIVAFHRDSLSGVHYHQMLHAFVRRHERLLDSIGGLVELRRPEHAEALARIAYEAFLNFYIDWLSPQFFGPRLQFLSIIRTAQSEGAETPKDSLAVLSNFVEFFESTNNKARISPLGPRFHNRIYPPLSLVVHQSYSHLEYEASDFNEIVTESEDRVSKIGRWLDLITASLVVRVRNEVGLGWQEKP